MEYNFNYKQKIRQESLIAKRRCFIRKRLHTIITAFIFTFLVIAIISANSIIARAGEGYEKQYQKQFVGVLVESGDTVWSIASEQLSIGYDTVTDLVEEISFINDLNESYEIQSGSILIIPYFCEV